jgi:hypothetical protein
MAGCSFAGGGDLALDLLREHNVTGDKDRTGNKECDMLDCVAAILCAAVAIAKQQDLPQLHRSFTAMPAREPVLLLMPLTCLI